MEKIFIGSRQGAKQFQEQETKLNKDSVIETMDGEETLVKDIKGVGVNEDGDYFILVIWDGLYLNTKRINKQTYNQLKEYMESKDG